MAESLDVEVTAEELQNQKDSIDAIFNLQTVEDSLKSSLIENEDVDLKSYTNGYRELYNFFLILGSVFGFVASDIKSKVQILEDFLEQDPKNFKTVKTMLTYEKDNKLFDNSKYVSGSRTLLRLHRGLNFIRQFLDRVVNLKTDDVKIGPVCKEAYDKCLGPYHTWVIRKTVGVAIYVLPTKGDFIRRITRETNLNAAEALAAIPHMLDTAGEVYNRVENFYTVYKLHDLK